MKPAIPTLLLAAALSTSVFGALTAAPIDAPLAAKTATALPQAEPDPTATPILVASGDEEGAWRLLAWGNGDHDDDHRKGHDDDEGDDDDDDGASAGGNGCAAGPSACVTAATAAAPAPAGAAAPPANGLFTPGAKPKVQTN